jgi:hypothetical protein
VGAVAQELPLAHVENLDLDAVALACQSEPVPIHEASRNRGLPLNGPLDGDETVPETRGLFEPLLLSFRRHLLT